MGKLLRVPAAEATLFQQACADCDTSVEVSLDRLATAALNCPGCGKEFRRPNMNVARQNFVKGLSALQQSNLSQFKLVLQAK
ncbi:MAG: hypothetical protein JSS27_05055 [Planctomycetes bacterium]|nr:hypothetical protein [Planctomycetota bacterium]